MTRYVAKGWFVDGRFAAASDEGSASLRAIAASTPHRWAVIYDPGARVFLSVDMLDLQRHSVHINGEWYLGRHTTHKSLDAAVAATAINGLFTFVTKCHKHPNPTRED